MAFPVPQDSSGSALNPEVLAALLAVVAGFFALGTWTIKKTIEHGMDSNKVLIKTLVSAAQSFQNVEQREQESHTAIMDALSRVMEAQARANAILAQISEAQGKILDTLERLKGST